MLHESIYQFAARFACCPVSSRKPKAVLDMAIDHCTMLKCIVMESFLSV